MRTVLGNSQRFKRSSSTNASQIDENFQPRRLEQELLSPAPKPSGVRSTGHNSQSCSNRSLMQLVSVTHPQRCRKISTNRTAQRACTATVSMMGLPKNACLLRRKALEHHQGELHQLQGAYQQQGVQLNTVSHRLVESSEALSKAQRAERNATSRFAHLQQLNTVQGGQVQELLDQSKLLQESNESLCKQLESSRSHAVKIE
eukprot:423952-Prymnesium_polylepis.1